MRIGVIAPEFPPMLGGMAELARGLTHSLAQTDTVRVYSFPVPEGKTAPELPDLTHIPGIHGKPELDIPTLNVPAASVPGVARPSSAIADSIGPTSRLVGPLDV